MTPEENARRVAEIRQEWADLRARAEAYLRDGRDYKDVAAELGVARSTIAGWHMAMRKR